MIYPPLSKIRTFATVAAEGSFRKAAAQLHLSQPALSAHIRDLERSLGIPLFHRTTRSVRLTSDGERFLARVRRALDEIESGVLELHDKASLQRGRVIVACVPTIACHVLPKVLATFSRHYSGIEVQVLDDHAQMVVRRVLDRTADIGIGPKPDQAIELEFNSIAHDRFVAVFPQKHPLAASPKVRLKVLLRYPLLTLRAGTNVRSVVEQAFRQQGVALRPAYEVLNHYTLGGMVEAGLGVTMLPSMALSMLSNPLLKTAMIVDPAITREVGIIQRRDQARAPAVEAFLQTLSQSFEV